MREICLQKWIENAFECLKGRCDAYTPNHRKWRPLKIKTAKLSACIILQHMTNNNNCILGVMRDRCTPGALKLLKMQQRLGKHHECTRPHRVTTFMSPTDRTCNFYLTVQVHGQPLYWVTVILNWHLYCMYALRSAYYTLSVVALHYQAIILLRLARHTTQKFKSFPINLFINKCRTPSIWTVCKRMACDVIWLQSVANKREKIQVELRWSVFEWNDLVTANTLARSRVGCRSRSSAISCNCMEGSVFGSARAGIKVMLTTLTDQDTSTLPPIQKFVKMNATGTVSELSMHTCMVCDVTTV